MIELGSKAVLQTAPLTTWPTGSSSSDVFSLPYDLLSESAEQLLPLRTTCYFTSVLRVSFFFVPKVKVVCMPSRYRRAVADDRLTTKLLSGTVSHAQFLLKCSSTRLQQISKAFRRIEVRIILRVVLLICFLVQLPVLGRGNKIWRIISQNVGRTLDDRLLIISHAAEGNKHK